jgi:Tfp pilus assembly protein PilE
MNYKLSKNQNGYTAIELILMAVLVLVLASILAATYGGIRERQRNNQRIDDLKTIQINLETFYASHSFYPTLNELNNKIWTSKYLKGVPSSDFVNPSSTTNRQDFSVNSTKTTFGYNVLSSSGKTCNDQTIACSDYTLTATQEGGSGTYSLQSLN